jgi:hypothetical protein
VTCNVIAPREEAAQGATVGIVQGVARHSWISNWRGRATI